MYNGNIHPNNSYHPFQETKCEEKEEDILYQSKRNKGSQNKVFIFKLFN